eukprot:TRINITY_DN22838_c0_g1_i1.p1 TRINITY_DN22838_c0_g1~~TRINITY_DN22838_c0_g1_i1.p1  ORF type:complete len:242 (-),score=57.68 TRINITY_DN22838_c0_g1_i1:193-918(-)
MGKRTKYKLGDPELESNQLEALSVRHANEDISKKKKNQKPVDIDSEAQLFALAWNSQKNDPATKQNAIKIASKLPSAGSKKRQANERWLQRAQLRPEKAKSKKQKQDKVSADGGSDEPTSGAAAPTQPVESKLTERKKRNYKILAERKKEKKRKKLLKSTKAGSDSEEEPELEPAMFGEVAERPPALAVPKRLQKAKKSVSKPMAMQMLEKEELRKSAVDNYRKMRASKGAPTLVPVDQVP